MGKIKQKLFSSFLFCTPARDWIKPFAFTYIANWEVLQKIRYIIAKLEQIDLFACIDYYYPESQSMAHYMEKHMEETRMKAKEQRNCLPYKAYMTFDLCASP